MKSENYTYLMNRLNDLITDSQYILNEIKSFNSWTVEKWMSVKSLAQKLQGLQDKFISNELYHIICMGELGNDQIVELAHKVQEIGVTRGVIKTVAGKNDITPLKLQPIAHYKSDWCNYTFAQKNVTE